MLIKWIRNNSSGLAMSILMGLLVVTFALWGVQGYFQQSSNDAAAVVNGDKISINDFSQRFSQYTQSLMSQFGDNFDPAYFESPVFRRNFLEQLINDKLLQQAARDMDFIASPQAVRDLIQSIPSFQNPDGSFNKESYAAYLTQVNQSPAYFQNRVQEDILSQATPDLVRETLFVTALEKNQLHRLNKQTRSFDYVLLNAADFKANVTLSDEEIQAHYDENQQQYMTPEKVSVDYIQVDSSELARGIDVNDEDARAHYEANQADYLQDEQRKAAHILIALAGDADDAAKAAAEAEINDLKTQIDAGADFAELAKAHSDDPGSAQAGGDLGWVEKGMMVQPFEEALFAMETGRVSEPVLSQFGYHLIQLNEIKSADYKPFEEVKGDIIEALQAHEAESLFLDVRNEVETLVLDLDGDLHQVAEQTDVELKTTELFERSGGKGIAGNPQFAEAAFSALVKDELQTSNAIDLGGDHVVYLKLNTHEPGALKPLEEVREQIVDVLTDEKARELAQQTADEKIQLIQSGEADLNQVATDLEKSLVHADDTPRTGSAQPYILVRNVFSMPRPAGETTEFAVLEANGLDLALVALKSVNDAEPGEDAGSEQYAAQLQNALSNNELGLFTQVLRAHANIKIYEERIEPNQ